MTNTPCPRNRTPGLVPKPLLTRVAALAFAASMTACGSPSLPTITGHKLSGTVLQQTMDGMMPAVGIPVEIAGRSKAITDSRGRYSLYGLQNGPIRVRIDFSIFEPIERDIQITSDTVADFQLVARPLMTLSGRITEMTAGGSIPVSGVLVEVINCSRPNGTYQLKDAVTDADGVYRIDGLCEGPAIVYANKSGYTITSANVPHCNGDGAECRWVTIKGDTRFDVEVGRQ